MENFSQNPEQHWPETPEPHQGSTLMKMPHKKWLPMLVIIVALIAGYFALAKHQFWWPFENTSSEFNLDDKTKGWQTYRNEKYGFEFKYPTNWVIRNGVAINNVIVEAVFVMPNGKYIEGGGFTNVYVNNIGESEILSQSLSGATILEKKSINLETKNADLYRIKQSFNQVESDFVIIRHNNFTLKVTGDSKHDEDQGIFNQILSTFKFVESN